MNRAGLGSVLYVRGRTFAWIVSTFTRPADVVPLRACSAFRGQRVCFERFTDVLTCMQSTLEVVPLQQAKSRERRDGVSGAHAHSRAGCSG